MSNGVENGGQERAIEMTTAGKGEEKPHPLSLIPVIPPMEAGPSTSASSPPLLCPDCAASVSRRYTWKGVLSAVLCFPCGIYCCLKTYARYQCSRCGCDIIGTTFPERARLMQHGYHFKAFQSTGYTPRPHRNPAMSVSSQGTDISTTSLDSQTPLIRRRQPE
ncbi:hypothetical protein PRIPAC_88516 [Pristionchus pacificus]|uniref:Brain protein I3 n=1 Tax=Pristionchus pacificus TaxID=54126 RepID=A0A2A6B8H1_PRIPA|nr:hypothetical protein PRIPAC_88516 [Pristionchus pacificus]|eukprot:PDM62171.1 hypothetical protein PRIPAC_51613 [Pristionchus pacificus]